MWPGASARAAARPTPWSSAIAFPADAGHADEFAIPLRLRRPVATAPGQKTDLSPGRRRARPRVQFPAGYGGPFADRGFIVAGRRGQWFDPTANVCRQLGQGPQPLNCPAGQYWDPTTNVCRDLGHTAAG